MTSTDALPTTRSGTAPAWRRSSRTTALMSLALASGLVGALPGSASATVVPPTPPNLPAGVEDLQPYVGQVGCDPVAKPGVSAFQRLLMATYRDTGSLGIVRDCGIGGQSEHKEGRALDWAVSVNNASNVAEVQAVTDWLTATVNGVPAANARRFGLMYMIWNHRIWKSYQLDKGWQAYTGPIPHTDHVHFSFGWSGARQATSWWTGHVAPIDYGPYDGGGPPPTPVFTPVVTPANLRVLAAYGALSLTIGSSGEPVRLVQATLGATPDGDYGPLTAGRVRDFQASQELPQTGVFGPQEWLALFPRPVDPFGATDAATSTQVSGWAIDADTSAPISVQVSVDGRATGGPVVAGFPRGDVAAVFPGVGSAHGFTVPLALGPGAHTVCVQALNVGPGADAPAGCAVAQAAPQVLDPHLTITQPVPGALATGAFSFGLSRPAAWSLTVRQGATVVATQTGSATAGVTGTWNGRDAQGHRAGAGAYTATVQLTSDGAAGPAWSAPFTLTAADADLYTVAASGTGSGRVEVHALTRASGYRTFSVHAATPLPVVAPGAWQFQFGPYGDDGRRDLYAIGVAGTSSGHVEVHVLSAASGYQQWVAHIATALPLPAPGQFDFAVGPVAGDGAPDFYAIKHSGAGTGHVEVHALSAASDYQTWVLHAPTALAPSAPGQFSYLVTGAGDLAAVARSATGSGHTEVHVLTAASGFQTFSVHAATPLGLTPSADFDYSLLDVNGDGSSDLAATVVGGTGSGMTEVHTLSGSSAYSRWIEHVATALHALDPVAWFVGLTR